MKSSEVSTKPRSPAASFSFKGEETKHTTVEWFIRHCLMLLWLKINATQIATIHDPTSRAFISGDLKLLRGPFYKLTNKRSFLLMRCK